MTQDGITQDPEAFGAWLARQLRRKGMSQSELAAKLDVTRAAVSAWITGRAMPRIEKIQAIEEVLGLAAGASVTRDEAPESSGFIRWQYRPAHIDGGRELGNAAAFAFDSSLAVTAREAAQNSLDERFHPDRSVRVRFTLHEISGERLRRFQEAILWDDLVPHIKAAGDTSQKVGRVLANGLRELGENGTLLLLRIDDYNAHGLTGPEYDDGRFAAVVRRQLDSHKKGTAGGSFGLGKATVWGASQFGLVIMNSTLSEPFEGRRERRVIGRIDLPWHKLDGEEYAGPAWLGEPDPTRGEAAARSWWATERTVQELYLARESSDPGTSFLIVGAYDPAGEATTLEKLHATLVQALATNFWASMVSTEGTAPPLEASVVALRNGDVVVPEERVNPHRYEPARSRALRAFLEGKTIKREGDADVRITNADDVVEVAVTLRVPRRKTEAKGDPIEHRAVLLVTPTTDSDERANHVVGMRGTRMTVLDRTVSRLPFGAVPFQAVLLAGTATGRDLDEDARAEEFLRAAEPPEHNAWKATEDLTTTYARGAATRLRDFLGEVYAEVRRVVTPSERAASDDGPPAVLRELMGLHPTPPPRRPGYPTVRSVTGELNDEGAWRLRVEIRLPEERRDPWFLRPILRFATRSGPKPEARWAKLVAESHCEVSGDVLICDPNERVAVFAGVSDVSSHPVPAHMAMAEVDVVQAKDGGR